MSHPDDLPINPYAAPEASLRGPAEAPTTDLAAAEATRRRYLNHEASVRSVGSLHLLGVFLNVLQCGVLGVQLMQGGASPTIVVSFVFALIFFGLNLGLGIGLRKLQPWARWVEAALTGLSCALFVLAIGLVAVAVAIRPDQQGPVLVGAVFGYGFALLIAGYILYLLVSPSGSVVFSPDYRDVIARTPHIKYKTGCLLKVLLVLIVVVLVLAVIGFVTSGFR